MAGIARHGVNLFTFALATGAASALSLIALTVR
jgi:hypothetical protein